MGLVCLLYIDGNVIPTLTRRRLIFWGIFDLGDMSWLIPQLSLWSIFLISETISLLLLAYSYWFLGWIGGLSVYIAKNLAEKAEKEKLVQEAIEIGKEIGEKIEKEIETQLVRRKGLTSKQFISWVQSEVITWYNKMFDQDHRFWKLLKRGGGIAFIVLAVSPEPFARTVAMITCRSINNKKYLVVLIICDIAKTAYMVLGWHVIINKLNWQTVTVLAVLFLGYIFYGKYKERREGDS